MAWNEPGNNNGNNGRDNDPWGNNNRGNKGGRDQGPPDLDEVFNKLSQKLGGKFGGKGGKGPSFSGGGAIGFGVIAAIAVAVWFFTGFIPSVKLSAALCYALANTTALLIRV